MRISDWSSDVCSSDLLHAIFGLRSAEQILREQRFLGGELGEKIILQRREMLGRHRLVGLAPPDGAFGFRVANGELVICRAAGVRSEEHPSEPQSLMRISYAVFCLTKKTYTLRQCTNP